MPESAVVGFLSGAGIYLVAAREDLLSPRSPVGYCLGEPFRRPCVKTTSASAPDRKPAPNNMAPRSLLAGAMLPPPALTPPSGGGSVVVVVGAGVVVVVVVVVVAGGGGRGLGANGL